MLTLAEIQAGMSKLKNWSLEGKAIAKEVEFENFKDAIDFVNRVAQVADAQGHFPTIMIEQNKVRLYATTPEENGLSEKDFNLAREIDKIEKMPEV